jgi:hypothetical protein
VLALRSKIAAASMAALCCILSPATANATGTLNIHRVNGAHSTYRDVEIKIFSGSLFLTSDDGDGTIVITRSACSYQSQLMVCLPTAAALVQDGESDALNLKTGTVYFNYSGAAQPLSGSSAKVPANSVLISIALKDGTFISVRGRIDEVIEE